MVQAIAEAFPEGPPSKPTIKSGLWLFDALHDHKLSQATRRTVKGQIQVTKSMVASWVKDRSGSQDTSHKLPGLRFEVFLGPRGP